MCPSDTIRGRAAMCDQSPSRRAGAMTHESHSRRPGGRDARVSFARALRRSSIIRAGAATIESHSRRPGDTIRGDQSPADTIRGGDGVLVPLRRAGDTITRASTEWLATEV